MAIIKFVNDCDIGLSFINHRNMVMNVLEHSESIMELDAAVDTESASYYEAFYDRLRDNMDEGLELHDQFNVFYSIPPDWGETISDMTGATATSPGVHGLVPQPMAGDNTKFLRGDGIWASAGGGGGGGTSDYNELANKPRINNKELKGEMTLEDIGDVAIESGTIISAVDTAFSK